MKRILALAVICFSLAIVTAAQEQNPGSFSGPNQIGSVDNQGIRNYLLGPGDLIDAIATLLAAGTRKGTGIGPS